MSKRRAINFLHRDKILELSLKIDQYEQKLEILHNRITYLEDLLLKMHINQIEVELIKEREKCQMYR